MFGLEKEKKKKPQDFQFELETELKNTKRHREVKGHVEDQIQKIKVFIQGGESKEEFEQMGVLLQGYLSLLKVMARILK